MLPTIQGAIVSCLRTEEVSIAYHIVGDIFSIVWYALTYHVCFPVHLSLLEWHNVFYRNLGALTKPPVGWNNPGGLIRPGESDHFPATFWITNPANDFIDNVAAGSRSTGMWFELKLRAPSSALAINEFSNPKTNPQGRFEGNAAHSNGFRAGITTYDTGYRAPPGTTWKNIKSYKNSDGGLFFHGTSNINLEGGLLADNKEAARNFGNSFASVSRELSLLLLVHLDVQKLTLIASLAVRWCHHLRTKQTCSINDGPR